MADPRSVWLTCFLGATAIIAIAVVSLVVQSLAPLREQATAMGRIPHADVQIELDHLQPAENRAGDYTLSGIIRNRSPRYTLTDVTFELLVEDCLSENCQSVGRGHAEILRRVPPSGAPVTFKTDIVHFESALPSPLGDRRLHSSIINTWGK